MTTYIFDFDGTLADSFSLACNILMSHTQYLGCKQLTKDELLKLKNMHAREVLKYLNIPLWRIPFFVNKIRKIVDQRIDEIIIFPEWAQTFQHLDPHHQLGLISSNSSKIVEYVLKKHYLFELFDFIACDQPLFGKKHCLKKLIKQKKINPTTTYYIGDEVRDIEAAQANNIHSIAVSWGFNSHERLKLANPDYLISHIEQLRSIFSEIN